VLDPAQGIHAVSDVAFEDGKVAAVGPRLPHADAAETVDCAGLLVAPGMIDLHVHVFYGVSHYGIEPDPHCVAKGVTTAVDAGSAGADTFSGFRKYVIDVAAGEKIPRKNGPGITQSDLLVINKLDLAPNVGASLEVMARDSRTMRGTRPFLFTNCMTNAGIDAVVSVIKREVLFEEMAPEART